MGKASELKLYELPLLFEQLADSIADADGEITPEIAERMDTLECQLESKVNGICSLIRRFTAQGEAAKAEADRLAKLAQSRANAATRLKAYLLENLERLGMQKYETDLFKVRVQQNSRPSIEWMGRDDAIPEELQLVRTTFDGQGAYEKWKAGEQLPENVRVTIGRHLRVS